ncbi:hypothetical protein BHM03_00057466 [Ensete ventricosum]|nr:hypothetical protein BHM03_00057466 [Ensete ventricosum]
MRKQEAQRSILPEENIRRQESQQLAISEEKLHDNRQELETRQSKPHNISIEQAKSQSIMGKRSMITESGPGRPVKYTSEQNEPIYSEEASVRAKLEFAKRKLHEGYQQAENGLC